ncbi:MAG: hypothetical protein RLZZ350_2380 [Verrucomicrobiota bacterium]
MEASLCSKMPNHPVGDFLGETERGVTSKNGLLGDFFQDGFHFVINRGVAANFVLGRKARGVVKPLADFIAAPVELDVRGAANDAFHRQVMLIPKPAKHEEGKTRAPCCGKNDMDFWPSIQNSPKLRHRLRVENVWIVGVVYGIQHPIYVEEDNVELHLF